MQKKKKEDSKPIKRRPPATTLEARENQMISLAVDLTEKKLLDGTASSQIISFYLKLASTKEQLEKEKLMKENELLKAKTDSLRSAKKIEELYSNALNAMRTYSGKDEADEYD